MKNVMTVAQISICAKRLLEQARLSHGILVDKRKTLDAIRDRGLDLMTEEDIRKADMLEEDIHTYANEEAALLALAEMILETEVVVSFKTMTGF